MCQLRNLYKRKTLSTIHPMISWMTNRWSCNRSIPPRLKQSPAEAKSVDWISSDIQTRSHKSHSTRRIHHQLQQHPARARRMHEHIKMPTCAHFDLIRDEPRSCFLKSVDRRLQVFHTDGDVMQPFSALRDKARHGGVVT